MIGSDGIGPEVVAAATAARRLMAAIEATTRAGPHTPDLGGTATTAEVTAALRRAIEDDTD